MKRVLGLCATVAFVAGAAYLLPPNAAAGGTSTSDPYVFQNATTRLAGPQHWCGTNGITCAEPSANWEEFAGYHEALARGAHVAPYIGHDEPATLFYSHKPGSGNDVTYQIVLPKDPPTRPTQDGSGGTYNFQLFPAFWFGMILCDPNGSPNPDGAALTGHATKPCTPDSDSNIANSENPASPNYFGIGPGQAYMEMQFYPPGWVNWPAGNGCTATLWCAALNIDTFALNSNTGQFNNTACLNTVGPEPVNFAFITKSGKATAPGSPAFPQHFVPVPSKDFLMGSGDHIALHMFDTRGGFRITLNDKSRGTQGSMTAGAANGFATVNFDPSASTCTTAPMNYHPMYSTSTPATRVTAAAHTYNVAFSNEIGHWEPCAKVKNNAIGTCLKPLGFDTNNADNTGPDPLGDDNFCLPGSAATKIKIGGCLDIDGDFDGVTYGHNWPGSVTNHLADALLHPSSILFTSPTTKGTNFSSMSFEADISRNESSDTEFGINVPCQRHVQNPADPSPGTGCVNPPPQSQFYPIFTTRNSGGSCWWQEGGPFIPGTAKTFGGNSKAEFGPIEAVHYPTAPFGAVTIRLNDFRRVLGSNPCKVG
jgi:hypothetical protein